MVPKQVFTGGALKAPPPYLMSIPEAPSCRVKIPLNNKCVALTLFDMKKHRVEGTMIKVTVYNLCLYFHIKLG